MSAYSSPRPEWLNTRDPSHRTAVLVCPFFLLCLAVLAPFLCMHDFYIPSLYSVTPKLPPPLPSPKPYGSAADAAL